MSEIFKISAKHKRLVGTKLEFVCALVNKDGKIVVEKLVLNVDIKIF